MSAWKQLLLRGLLATAALAIEGRHPRPTAWPHAVPLQQHQTRNTPIISSKATLAHQPAASNTTSWATGDFVAAGEVRVGTQGDFRRTVRVYDGRTLQLKADWSPLVEAACGAGFNGKGVVTISSPGLSPDNQRSMGLACYDLYGGKKVLATINITDINAPTVQSSTFLSINIQSMQYNREGNLVVLAWYPSDAVLLFNTSTNAFTSQTTFRDPGTAFGQDLTTDGVNLLMPDASPEVLSFNLSTGALSPINFASIPGGLCLTVLAQYDGSALVGCYSSDRDRWCVYHVAGPGLNSSTSTSTILNKWCTASQGLATMVMDVDRESFVVNTYSESALDGDASVPNSFRLRLSDFALVANWSVPAWWNAATAYGALPANQQNCPVGFKQCCSPSGAVRPKGAVCSSSPEPCLLDATCDGTSITCPTQQKAADGTPCSLAPAGMFKAASGPLGRMAAAADISDAEAMKDGYKKCHRCFDGQCVKRGKVKRQEGRLAEFTPAEPWFSCR